MSDLDRHRLEQIVETFLDQVEGEWLLVGGALVALWLEPRRLTEDIDLIGLVGSQAERIRLLSAAELLGLPVEALNSAADYFIREIDVWRDHLVLFQEGMRGVLYRPTVYLFIRLKMKRLSEQDLLDCRAALAYVQKEEAHPRDKTTLFISQLLQSLGQLPGITDEELKQRRHALRTTLESTRHEPAL